MKIELSLVDGFHTYACLEPVNHPVGYYSFKVSTRWQTAKDPDSEHIKCNLLLSPEALHNLRELIK